MSAVELHATIHELARCQELARTLHGTSVEPDAVGGRRRPDVAVVTRDLLALSDRLDLLASMVKQEYWAIKGLSRVVEA